jgi:heme A synthase
VFLCERDVLAQVTLGAFVIWSEKNVAINTAHVVVGALTLATSLVLTLRAYRVRFEDAPAVMVRVPHPLPSDLGRSEARA